MGREKGGRHVVAMPDQPHFVAQAMAGDELDEFLPVSGLPRGVARKDDGDPLQPALSGEMSRRFDGLTLPF